MPLKIYFGFILCATSFTATFGTVFLKCQPISKNWQIYPDPGNWCQPAMSQIQAWIVITMTIATDLHHIYSGAGALLFKMQCQMGAYY